ncbi:MAG: EAL domain-containing protein [Desulfobacterales bacterium]
MQESIDREVFLRGSKIFRDGEPGNCAYLIEKGSVEISSHRKGKKIVLATLSEGELLGEMALIDNSVRSATATALEETEVVVISLDYLKNKFDQADPMLKLLLNVILGRFRATQRKLLGQATDKECFAAETASGIENQIYKKDQERVITDLRFKKELEHALIHKEFELHYQPIIALNDGSISSFEALIRWNHPIRGLIPPNQFVGFAEETGLITPIGIWVFQEACNALNSFHARHSPKDRQLPPIAVSVNASTRQLFEPEFIEKIPSVLQKTGIDPKYIHLEITETLLMENPDLATITLNKIKEMGIKLVIDDFGTGYSSLSYLHRFPIQTLKIDRSFVITMLENTGSMEIVRAVAGLAHNLGIEIIAEGVETREQLSQVCDLKCDYAQGYHFSRPIPISVALKLLEK